MVEDRTLVRRLGGKETAWKIMAKVCYNIKSNIKEIGCGGTDWIDLAYNRDRWRTLANAVMNHRVSQYAGNLLALWKPVSFSRKTPQMKEVRG